MVVDNTSLIGTVMVINGMLLLRLFFTAIVIDIQIIAIIYCLMQSVLTQGKYRAASAITAINGRQKNYGVGWPCSPYGCFNSSSLVVHAALVRIG